MNDERPVKTLILPQPALATLKIVDADQESGYVIINESDFDKSTMKKFVDKKPDAPKPDAPPA